MRIKDFVHYPAYCDTVSSILKYLNYKNVSNPLSGEPLNESILFAFYGGIGFQFPFTSKSPLSSITNINGNFFSSDIQKQIGNLPDFLPLKHTILTEEIILEEALEYYLSFGNPLVLQTQISGKSPFIPVPALGSEAQLHTFIVYGFEDNKLIISDMSNKPVQLSINAFLNGESLYEKPLIMISFDEQKRAEITADVFRSAFSNSLKQNISELHQLYFNSVEANPLLIWKDQLLKFINLDSVANPYKYINILINLYIQIKYSSTSLVNSRLLFSSFLNECAIVFQDELFFEARDEFISVSKLWNELADLFLPEEVELLSLVRQTLNKFDSYWKNDPSQYSLIKSDLENELNSHIQQFRLDILPERANWSNKIEEQFNNLKHIETEVIFALDDLMDLV